MQVATPVESGQVGSSIRGSCFHVPRRAVGGNSTVHLAAAGVESQLFTIDVYCVEVSREDSEVPNTALHTLAHLHGMGLCGDDCHQCVPVSVLLLTRAYKQHACRCSH